MRKSSVIVFQIKRKMWQVLKDKKIITKRKLFDEKGSIGKTFYGQSIISAVDGNDLCFNLLNSDAPCMIGRIGTIEMGAVNASIMKKYGVKNNIKAETKSLLSSNAGFFGKNGSETTDYEIMEFYQVYKDALKETDAFAVFESHNEDLFIHNYGKNDMVLMQLCSLESYYFDIPWTRVLKGKKVLVIHPFAETIEKQYKNNRSKLFENSNILPDFELYTIKAVQSIGGKAEEFKDWFEALDYMKDKIHSIDFDIAVIGCGAYGFPLAAYIKKLGKKSIVTAGSTQLLFGIKGSRWDGNSLINKNYNEYWCRPNENEKPLTAENVEGGCYW